MTQSFDAETEKALETYISRDNEIENRSEAIEKIVKVWLAQNGYVGGSSGTRPQDLDASNDD